MDKVTPQNKIISNRTFLNNDTAEQVSQYIDEICSDPKFLCDNKEMCGKNTSIYTSVENVNKICTDMKKGNECDTQIKECVVTTENLFDEARQTITTSFVNIIIPITNAFDDLGNQKFLRLPALSSSKNPKSQDICNICACMNRFSTVPGSSNAITENSYTAPGQNICIYPDFIEHYYYPMNIENITNKLKDTPPIKLGKYTILNTNIIYAHTEEDLLVPNLYDILLKNKISDNNAKTFILKTLYKNNSDKSKELQLYLNLKQKQQANLVRKGIFYENITFFYIILAIFIVLLLINLIK